MKFKYSAFIENSPEMREWLKLVGYNISEVGKDDPYLVATVTVKGIGLSAKGVFVLSIMEKIRGYINCLGNPDLFKAVTAVREDSDYMQWFVADEDTFTRDGDVCIWRKGHFLFSIDNDYIGENQEEEYQIKAHKATLEELQEHFKIN